MIRLLRSIRGEYWAVAAGLCFVGLELSVRTAAPFAPPNLGSFVRVLPILVAAWIGALATQGSRKDLARLIAPAGLVLLLALVVDGVLNMYAGNALKIFALQKGGIVLTLTAVEVGNLLGAALLVRLWFRHKVSTTVLAGIIIIIIGTAVASWSRVFVPSWGEVLGISLIAGLCFAVSVTCVGYVLRQGIGLWPALAVSASVGFIIAAVIASATNQAPTAANIGAIGSVGVGFLLLSGIAYFCALFFLTGALQRLNIVSANAISGANGPVAAFAGALIFGPSVTWLLIIGVALVAWGAIMVRARNARDELEDATRGRARSCPVHQH